MRSLLRRNAVFKNLWLAQGGSWFGDYFNSVALAAVTLALTGSAAAMALVLLCRGVPAFVAGPLWGPAVDRWPKRVVLYATDLARAAIALSFIVAYDRRQMWILYAGAALLGVCSSLFLPARRAAVRQVVHVKDLVPANALDTGTAGFVAVLGAAGGGLVSALVSPDLAFAVNAASYLWSAAWILAAKWSAAPPHAGARAGYFAELAAGARALAGHRVVLAAVLASLGFALTSGPYYVAPPVLGDLVYGMGGLGIGLLFAADGLGFIVSAALVRRVPAAQLRSVYGGSYFVQAAFLCLLCLSTRLWEGMAAIFISQVAAGTILTLTTAFLQQHAPQAVQGRVFAVQSAMSGALGQASIAVAGLAMARYGVPAVGLPVALVCVVAGALWLRLTGGQPTAAAA